MKPLNEWLREIFEWAIEVLDTLRSFPARYDNDTINTNYNDPEETSEESNNPNPQS